MAIDRRSVLLGTLTAVAAQPWDSRMAAAVEPARPSYAAAAKTADGRYAIVLLDADGRLLRQIALSDRGHDIAVDRPGGRAVAFARRPGTFAVAFDTGNNAPPQIITAIDGRHFFGHGAFSAGGQLLYASENDIATGEGVIGIYDAARGFKRIGEHRSFGTGPHEIILMGDGVTLAVANGGIDTTPQAGRESLNIETMHACLVFINSRTGDLVARHDVPGGLQRLSIRHLASDNGGNVWFGGQWQGDVAETPELVGVAAIDRPLRMIAPAAPLGLSLKGYIGSMAASAGGSIIAASAPKAGRAIYLDASSGRLIGETAVKDVCGIADGAGSLFALTSGFGTFRIERPAEAVLSSRDLDGIAFDNHLRRLG